MAAVGSKIFASDYNVLQSTISTVMGVGTSFYGYNQIVQSSQITATSGKYPPIKLNQWIALRTDILNAYTHLGLSGYTIPGVPSNANKVTAVDYANYQTLVNAIYTGSTATPPSGQASLSVLSSSSHTNLWNGTLTHTVTLTWPSVNAVRGFFNSGSNIQFTATLTGYSNSDASTVKDNDWNTLLTNMGTITMNYASTINTGSYTTRASSVGYYQLTTTPQLIFQKTTSTPTYNPNQYDIYASVDATGTIVTFSIKFADLSTGTIDENVEGTLTSNVKAYYSSGSSVSAVLPSVTYTGP